MQGKIELFNDSPQSIKKEIARHLSNRDLRTITWTSKENWAFFKPMLDVRKFLGHVVHGEHDAVQSMLKNDMSLILKRGSVTDYSGRYFEDISGFEYALWALDQPMWTMMRECIPKNEEGKEVLAQLLAQYNNIITDRVTYRLHGRTITESHFDFKNTIIHELQKQVDSMANTPMDEDCNDTDSDTDNEQWTKGVGGAQKLLPVHVVYKYCSKKQITSQLSMNFYNWETHQYENWFAKNSKLGDTFAISNGNCSGAGNNGQTIDSVGIDLDVMEKLYEVVTKGFIELESQLKEQLNYELRTTNHSLK